MCSFYARFTCKHFNPRALEAEDGLTEWSARDRRFSSEVRLVNVKKVLL